MISTWIGSLVLCAYPSDVRLARGEEMLGTLLDAREDSEWAFIRGCTSLLGAGLRDRARANAQIRLSRLVADGFCQAALLWSLWMLLRWRLPPEGYSDTWPVVTVILLIGVVICWALGRDRVGGICGLVAVSPGLFQSGSLVGYSAAASGLGFVRWLVVVGCFWVMVLKPRVRAHNWRKLIWLIPAAALLLAPMTWTEALLLVGVPALGIVQLPVSPRLAIASSVFWIEIALASRLGNENLGLVTIPVLLLAVVLAVAQQKIVLRRALS